MSYFSKEGLYKSRQLYNSLLIQHVNKVNISISQLINLYRDPQGENIFDKSNPTITAKFETTGSDAVPSFYNPDNATATLQKKICEQEEEIRDKAELVAKLRLELSTFKVISILQIFANSSPLC